MLGVLIVLTLLLNLVSAVYWLMWTYRAYDNLRRVGSKQTDMTPGWVVGWWFVPFANLWMPYKIMREISARSELGNDYALENGTLSGIVEWWFLFIVSSVLDRISARTDNVSLEIISAALDVAYIFYAIKVVRGVSELQQKMRNPVPVRVGLNQL